ncbi:ABC transporter ATP-binding protein [Candidatus Gracilibacteria bacterium]|nr:ABC transporter ATP-binding protein [Candidatus Gracilibacteria bacterium]NJS41057.1 ABC transporter ATP-binding protein [Candidatus Gracilibacteria bacterium]
MSLISAIDLVKNYGTKKNPIKALGPVNFEIHSKSFTLILGKSGSGKSTLLNLLAGLDKSTSGSLIVQNKNLSTLSQRKLSKYRANIGIIFQFYNLLPNLNSIENVMMGSWAGGVEGTYEYAEQLLKDFGIDHRAKANVKTLSGGEKQRVAICRALVSQPEILFCDEPTGALDSTNERQVIKILQGLSQKGLTIIMVTHSQEFRSLADQIIYLKDGLITDHKNFNHQQIPQEEPNPNHPSSPNKVHRNPDEPLPLTNSVANNDNFNIDPKINL